MLEIHDLSKTYADGGRSVRALQSVSLELDTGLFGLLGPNGAGKSTLMRTLATLQKPDAGTVRLDGRDIFEDPQAHRRRLGYLPQEFGVYPGLSAWALLDHLALLKGVTDRRRRHEQIEALLHRTHLHDHRKRAVSRFSGGMRRRFGIAQALLGDPRLILVDEPTAGLDPEERHRFHDLLVEVGERVIVVLSTHLVDDVRQLCSRMAILHEGRLRLTGDPQNRMAELDGRVWQRTVERGSEAAPADARTLSTRLHRGKTQVRILADACPGEGFEQRTPELEDVYFAALNGLDRSDRRAA